MHDYRYYIILLCRVEIYIFLPVIFTLGKHYVAKVRAASEFSETVDPSVSNSFATAAIQFVSSLMQGTIR